MKSNVKSNAYVNVKSSHINLNIDQGIETVSELGFVEFLDAEFCTLETSKSNSIMNIQISVF